jgi:hypothetical protein
VPGLLTEEQEFSDRLFNSASNFLIGSDEVIERIIILHSKQFFTLGSCSYDAVADPILPLLEPILISCYPKRPPWYHRPQSVAVQVL